MMQILEVPASAEPGGTAIPGDKRRILIGRHLRNMCSGASGEMEPSAKEFPSFCEERIFFSGKQKKVDRLWGKSIPG